MSTAGDGAFEIDPQGFLAEADEAGAANAQVPPGGSTAQASAAEGIASLERIEEELAAVEQALIRLDEGRYGVCDSCGATIADIRLAEHPAARFCEGHQPAAGATSAG